MNTHPEFVKLDLCFWRTLPVPPMTQLVQSSHPWTLHSTRVLLARTTCAADDAAGAISARFEVLFNPCAPGTGHLCHRWYSSTHLEPLLDQCAPGAHYLCGRQCMWRNLHTPRAFTRPVCSWRALPVRGDDTACAFSKRLGSLLDPRSPGKNELCRQCCGLCSLRTCQVLARPVFNWPTRTVPPTL